MENDTGKLTGYCPLFDHDRAFSMYDLIWSQTTEEDRTLKEAAEEAQRQLRLNFSRILQMEPPPCLEAGKWQDVRKRCEILGGG